MASEALGPDPSRQQSESTPVLNHLSDNWAWLGQNLVAHYALVAFVVLSLAHHSLQAFRIPLFALLSGTQSPVFVRRARGSCATPECSGAVTHNANRQVTCTRDGHMHAAAASSDARRSETKNALPGCVAQHTVCVVASAAVVEVGVLRTAFGGRRPRHWCVDDNTEMFVPLGCKATALRAIIAHQSVTLRPWPFPPLPVFGKLAFQALHRIHRSFHLSLDLRSPVSPGMRRCIGRWVVSSQVYARNPRQLARNFPGVVAESQLSRDFLLQVSARKLSLQLRSRRARRGPGDRLSMAAFRVRRAREERHFAPRKRWRVWWSRAGSACRRVFVVSAFAAILRSRAQAEHIMYEYVVPTKA